jgi:hypothetical protein
MGHRRLIITLIYAQLVDNGSGEFTVKTSRTVEKAYSKVEAGFEHVTEMEGVKTFRKRK